MDGSSRHRRYTVLIIAAVVVAGIVAAVIIHHRSARDDIGPTAVVERGAIERIVVASGTIEPEDLVEVRAKVSGIVKRFFVKAGDRVTAGQIVAELDRETLEASVREARGAVREAEVERDHAALELQRKHTLFGRGVESKEALDGVQAEHARAEARLERAAATLQRLQQELAFATIVAPIDGVVLERDLNPGAAIASVAAVTGGTVLMTIADTAQMHLLGIVDENDIAHVHVGMQARIRTDTYPDRVLPGRVSKIASIGNRKNNVTSFKVEVTVLDGVDLLWARMSADADIIADVHENALLIPESALVYAGNDIFVEAVEHASAPHLARRPVRVGISNHDRVEILDGLSATDVVKLQ